MKITDINIRDPYVLLYEGKYYLYGTRSATCWGPADGFDCYVGEDLENWEGPIEVFHRPQDFFATENFWAPECYFYQGAFYFITTFGAPGMKKGLYGLKSEKPEGPYELYGERLTPEDWTCIDGTLYIEGDTPYLIFSHSFEDDGQADISVTKLASDLSHAEGEPWVAFPAKAAPWAKPFPWAKQEFGIEGDCFFTDGPSLRKMESGNLYMLWSSWGTAGYAVGVARSESGSVTGPWKQAEQPVWPENGGHGMMFEDKNGELVFVLHYPNDKYAERPIFRKMTEKDQTLVLEDE
ncbi:MAG: glycoside hydrolase family 43 protein [Clostridiales bacterium]|nr:glycoside hydrolase family 43 protein [Clostridiales bacterium]